MNFIIFVFVLVIAFDNSLLECAVSSINTSVISPSFFKAIENPVINIVL